MDVNTVMTRVANMLKATQETECDCSEFYDVMDEVVEAIEAGVDLSEARPDIVRHLEMCPCCKYELEALKKILQAGELA